MKTLLTFLLLSISSQLFAHGTDPVTVTAAGSEQTNMKIQGTRIPCNGTDGNTQCFQVQKGASIGTDFWEILPEPIEGFSFEEGYSYMVTVTISKRENPTAGQSKFVYQLVQIISKTQE